MGINVILWRRKMETKSFEISVHQLETMMKLIRMEQAVAARMANYVRYQELQLKCMEEIKKYCEVLAAAKKQYPEWWASLDPELKKVISKYSKSW